MFPGKEDRNLTMFCKMMKWSGMWLDFDSTRTYKTLVKLYVIYLVLSIYVAQYVALSVGFKKSYIISTDGNLVLAMLFPSVEMVLYLFHRKPLINFIDRMRMILKKRDQEWEIKIFKDQSSRSWRFTNIYFNMFSSFYVFTFIGYFILDTVKLALGYPPISGIPNLFSGLLKDPYDRSWVFYVTTICTDVTMLVGFMSNCLICFLPNSVSYIASELHIIRKHLEMWSEDRRNPNRDAVFRKIIQEHIEIQDIIHMIRRYYGELYIAVYIFMPLSLTLTLFGASEDLSRNEISMFFKHTHTLFGLMLLVFINCWSGQVLHDETESFSEGLYMLPWYLEVPKVRKELLMMMVNTQTPVYVEFKGALKINRMLYSEIMNACYSYFMILQSLK